MSQLKVYKINTLIDWSYKGSIDDIEEVMLGVNKFFRPYGIKFNLEEYMRSGFIAKDSTMSSSLDNFCNCNAEKFDLTLGITGTHKGKKIGMAYKSSFGTKYSCAVVDLNTNKEKAVCVLIHEILHTLGLPHSDDSNNIMHSITTKTNTNKEQDIVIQQYAN